MHEETKENICSSLVPTRFASSLRSRIQDDASDLKPGVRILHVRWNSSSRASGHDIGCRLDHQARTQIRDPRALRHPTPRSGGMLVQLCQCLNIAPFHLTSLRPFST